MTNTDNPTDHAVRRPLCATCFRQPREDGSARCTDCGPGRILTPRPRRTPLDRAAELLGVALDGTDEGGSE